MPSVEALSTTTTRSCDALLDEHRVETALERGLRVAHGDADGDAGAALLAEDGDGVAVDRELAQLARDRRLEGGCRSRRVYRPRRARFERGR